MAMVITTSLSQMEHICLVSMLKQATLSETEKAIPMHWIIKNKKEAGTKVPASQLSLHCRARRSG